MNNTEHTQLLLNVTVKINPPLDGILSHAETSLKSAHFYLSDNKILKPTLHICYYYHCLSKGDKSLLKV